MSIMLDQRVVCSLQVFMEYCSGSWPARAHIFCGARLVVRHLRINTDRSLIIELQFLLIMERSLPQRVLFKCCYK